MIKEQISQILKELVPDKEIEGDNNRLVTIGSSSLLSLQFVTVIEEAFEIQINNNDITYQFFSDITFVEELIKKYKA